MRSIGNPSRNPSKPTTSPSKAISLSRSSPSSPAASGRSHSVSAMRNMSSPSRSGPSSPAASAKQRINKLVPDPKARGPHTVFKTDPKTGKISGYQTFKPQTNPRNPNPWESVKRFDAAGRAHFNKVTKQLVPTPHVQEPGTPGGVRLPKSWEIPRR